MVYVWRSRAYTLVCATAVAQSQWLTTTHTIVGVRNCNLVYALTQLLQHGDAEHVMKFAKAMTRTT